MSNKQHGCFKKVNRHLKKYNTELVTNMLNPNDLFIDTVKIDRKKRERRSMIAIFCPFCGKDLDEQISAESVFVTGKEK